MHIIEQYALNTGAKIDKPIIFKKYYPIPFEKYVTCHFSSGMESKNWDKWPIVIRTIAADLHRKGYGIIQLGAADDLIIAGVPNMIRLCGKTDLSQSNFIISNSSLHLCNDTFSAHVAGALEIPLISLYTVSPKEVCGPYWRHPQKTLLLESGRGGNKPSYSNQESPKTINEIGIEQVINGINEFLNLGLAVNVKPVDEGDEFARGLTNPITNFILELIPDDVFQPQFSPRTPYPIRDDLVQNDQNLFNQMNLVPSILISSRKIDMRLLSHPNMHGYMLKIDPDNYDLNFYKELRRARIKHHLMYFPENAEFFNDKKLEMSDVQIPKKIIYARQPKLKEDVEYKFFTSKFFFSNGKHYASYYDWKNGVECKNPAELIPLNFKKEILAGEFEALEQAKFSCFFEKTSV